MRYLVLALALTITTAEAHAQCGLEQVLGGEVRVDLVPLDGGAYGLVQNSSFDTKEINGALRGTITVERGHLSIYNRDGVVVGSLPKVPGPFSSDECAGTYKLRRSGKEATILNANDKVVSVIQGSLPK